MPATFRSPGSVAALSVIGDEIVPLLSGANFEVFSVTGPPDSGPPPHSHPWDEGYVILEGSLAVVADGEERVLGAGESVLIPANTTHLYRIASPDARFIVTTSGDRAGAFFADIDRSVEPGVPTEATLPGIIEVAKRNGLSSPLF